MNVRRITGLFGRIAQEISDFVVEAKLQTLTDGINLNPKVIDGMRLRGWMIDTLSEQNIFQVHAGLRPVSSFATLTVFTASKEGGHIKGSKEWYRDLGGVTGIYSDKRLENLSNRLSLKLEA